MKLAIAILACLLAGCTTWSPETKVEETTFLTLHAVDGLQTADIHNTRGCYEAESAWAMGREPSARSTAGYFAALAVAHVAITQLMIDYDAPPWALRTWELIGIAWNVRDVSHNAQLGIKIK
jgi:hypothetical protein